MNLALALCYTLSLPAAVATLIPHACAINHVEPDGNENTWDIHGLRLSRRGTGGAGQCQGSGQDFFLYIVITRTE
jgi:hypothetical protein